MANVIFQMEEQLSDLRSNESAYRFTVENRGSKTVLLRTVTPRFAERVTLLEVKDTSERAVRLKHETLCNELTIIVNAFLARRSGESKEYAKLLRRLDDQDERSIGFKIESTRDARTALETWFASLETEHVPEKQLFEAKLTQLERYQDQMEREGPSHAAIATLAPGSVFATTYVFRFGRGGWDPRKYTVTIEASYNEEGSDIVETGAVSASAVISPPPFLLSIVAIISSVLGAILKTALSVEGPATAAAEPISAGSAKMPVTVGSLPLSAAVRLVSERLVQEIVTLDTLGGMVLALVIFNIYEHTELGARVTMGVGWRSALLIGVLAGLFTQRLLAALGVFIGVR